MLRNFVVAADLKRYDSVIEKYLPVNLPDWQFQVDEAFEVVKDRIRGRGIELRRTGIPLDLNRAANDTTNANALAPLTKTATYTSTHIGGQDGFHRFVVNVTAMTGTSGYVFALQGSNDQQITTTTEPSSWTAITTLTPTATGEIWVSFTDEYKYYRIVLTITAGTPSITFTASLLEMYADRWVIWQALQIIYQMISKSPEDVWAKKAHESRVHFDFAFNNYVFMIDKNDDNQVTVGDKIQHGLESSFVR